MPAAKKRLIIPLPNLLYQDFYRDQDRPDTGPSQNLVDNSPDNVC